MSFFFCKISQKNVFENILETKKSFEDYNIEKLKKSKNWDFSKGVSPWFGSKLWNKAMFLFFAK